MDSRQLRYFAAIHEYGSLSRAAENLNVATSALSHHLTNLEDHLGTQLFIRRPRGLLPTAAGERLYEHARGILRSMEAAEQDLRGEAREIVGEISVGMAHSAVRAIGLTLIETVLRDYPRLKMTLSESLSGSTLVHLMASEIDLAVIYNPPQDAALRTQPILEERMVCVGRPELIGATEDPITFDELLELPIILLKQGLSARALMDDVNLLKKLEARALLNLNSVSAISGALRAGLGCATGTSLFMRDQLQSGELIARPIIEPELSRTLYICERADRPATFALERVRSMILQMIYSAINKGDWDAKAASESVPPKP